MKNKNISLLLVSLIALLTIGVNASALTNPQVQTNSVTNIQNNSATLNGSLNSLGQDYYTRVWFQFGESTGYGNETASMNFNYAGNFSQTVNNLAPNTLIHYRAVAQNSYTTVYGQDMTFTSGQTGYWYGQQNAALNVSKQVINLSSGNLNWSQSIAANPNDILKFSITLYPTGNQNITNVVVRDMLPWGLNYYGNLTVNGNTNYYGNDITSGITFNTLSPGQSVVITYQAQVGPSQAFSYNSTTINNTTTITSNQAGAQTASALVYVNQVLFPGITYVPTGSTNNFLTESFFVPLMLLIAGFWAYRLRKKQFSN